MNRIRAARQAHGWTQSQLARRAGISTRTIHAVEMASTKSGLSKRKQENCWSYSIQTRHSELRILGGRKSALFSTPLKKA